MKKENNISLVMIAKNEELGLEKAITSCRDFVKEVIVSVDDVSTDRTMEVAKKFADKVITHKWNGSFAEARNNVQKLAKTKWILYLDGHEYVKNYEDLEENLKTDADGIFVKIIMESGMTFFYPRIVKKEIKWQHKVHNTPKSKRNVKFDSFVIIHDRVNLQAKKSAEIREKQRTEMLEKELIPDTKKNKKNVRANFYLGNLYLDTKEWKKAIPYYKKVAKYGEKENQKWLARFHLGICYNELKKPLYALWHFWKGEEEQPNRWENAKMIGTSYAFFGWNKKAIESWVDSFKINTGQFMFNPILRNDAETWDWISLAFAVLGNTEKSKIACRQALREERENGPGLLSLEKIRILEEVAGHTHTSTKIEHEIEVCFVVYQRPERVPKILEQLKTQSIQNFKVNIWNNTQEDLDISNFPADRIHVSNSMVNVGSKARFYLPKKTKGNPIIFFDDDQELHPNFIEYNYRQYLKFGPKCILGWFTRIFNQESYWKSTGAIYGQEVDYVATKAMIFDREIIDKEPLLQNIPKEFEKVEDLYLCYLARMKHNMKMIKIEPYTQEKPDGKDQWKKIDKEKAFKKLREKGWDWCLIKDKKREILLKNYNKKIWVDTSIEHNDVLARGLLKNSIFYEEPLLEFSRKLKLDKNKAIVDVGANVGNHTIFFSLFCPHSKIFAFEPYDRVRNSLERHIEMNKLKNIKVFPYAVGEKTGFCDLEKSPRNEAGIKWDGRTCVKEGNSIKMITLDEILKDEPVSLIKIDVEGYEYKVLQGAKKILEKEHPYLFVEAVAPEIKEKIDNYLSSFGYECKARLKTISATFFYEQKKLNHENN